MDIDFFSRKEIRIIKNKYEAKAVALILLILCEIYRENGYYLNLDDNAISLLACDVDLCDDDVENIIALGVKLGFFDKDMFFDHNILTSKEIQRNYIKAIERRKETCIKSEYFLLTEEEDQKDIDLSKVTFTGMVNVNINGVNVDNNPVNVDISTQSRVDKSRVDNTRVEEKKEEKSKVDKIRKKESKQEESTVNNSTVEEKKVEESTSLSIPSFTSSLINSYTNNSTLSSLLTSYMEYRVKNNLDMSEKYINNLVHLLDKLADNDEQKIIIVDTALKKNWKSFFPIDFERLEREQQQANNRDYIKGNENFDDQYLFDL